MPDKMHNNFTTFQNYSWVVMSAVETAILTFQNLSHRDKARDTLGNFTRDNWEVIFYFCIRRRIWPRQDEQHELKQFAVLHGRLTTGLHCLHSGFVCLRYVGSTLFSKNADNR